MARFEIEGIDELMKDLSTLDAEKLAPAMLGEAAPILKGTVVSAAASHRDTGEMVASIKETKVRRNQSGYYISVRPTGKDGKGVRNMEKMAALEYGVGGRQAATPVLTSSVHSAEEPVVQKMQEVFDREIKL